MTQQQQNFLKYIIGWKLQLSFYWKILPESENKIFEKILRTKWCLERFLIAQRLKKF